MSFNYCGGIPEMTKPDSVEIVVTPKHIEIVQAFKKNIKIPVESIKDVSLKTEEQISKDVTLTRLFLLGVFAFGAKKKTKQVTNYLVIDYESGGISCSGIFTGDKAAKVYAQIAKMRQAYLQKHPVPAEKSPSAPADTSAEIEKFYRLKEQGIITEEEFQAKKNQLLGL